MTIEFAQPCRIAGHLEQIEGQHVGVRIPFRYGITFIGSSRACSEYLHPEQLRGIIEAAQIYIKMDEGCAITDATSTNSSSLTRRLPSKEGETVIEIPYEAFDTELDDRRWMRVYPEDVLCHVYGRWRFSF